MAGCHLCLPVWCILPLPNPMACNRNKTKSCHQLIFQWSTFSYTVKSKGFYKPQQENLLKTPDKRAEGQILKSHIRT